MTIKAHIYLDGEHYRTRLLDHIFALGDTVRIAPDRCALVAEVIWCLDEEWTQGQRVNIRLVSEDD